MGLPPEQTSPRNTEYQLLPHTPEPHTQLPPLWEGKESPPVSDRSYHKGQDSQTLPLPLYPVLSSPEGRRE